MNEEKYTQKTLAALQSAQQTAAVPSRPEWRALYKVSASTVRSAARRAYFVKKIIEKFLCLPVAG